MLGHGVFGGQGAASGAESEEIHAWPLCHLPGLYVTPPCHLASMSLRRRRAGKGHVFIGELDSISNHRVHLRKSYN